MQVPISLQGRTFLFEKGRRISQPKELKSPEIMHSSRTKCQVDKASPPNYTATLYQVLLSFLLAWIAVTLTHLARWQVKNKSNLGRYKIQDNARYPQPAVQYPTISCLEDCPNFDHNCCWICMNASKTAHRGYPIDPLDDVNETRGSNQGTKF